MRETIIRVVVLVALGAVVMWKEWQVGGSSLVIESVNIPTLNVGVAFEPAILAPSFVVWLVVAGILFLLTDIFSRYLFKLSSPNSV